MGSTITYKYLWSSSTWAESFWREICSTCPIALMVSFLQSTTETLLKGLHFESNMKPTESTLKQQCGISALPKMEEEEPDLSSSYCPVTKLSPTLYPPTWNQRKSSHIYEAIVFKTQYIREWRMMVPEREDTNEERLRSAPVYCSERVPHPWPKEKKPRKSPAQSLSQASMKVQCQLTSCPDEQTKVREIMWAVLGYLLDLDSLFLLPLCLRFFSS